MGVLLSFCLFFPAFACAFRAKDKGLIALSFCLLIGGYLQLNLSSIVIVQDFVQYCETIDAIRMNRIPLYNQRSIAALYPAAILSEYFGIIDALLIINTLAFWGTVLAFRTFLRSIEQSIWLIFPLIICFPPIVLMGSMLDSTPVIVMVFTWASVLTFVGVKKNKPWLFGIALGLALLVDVRGILWVLPIIGCWFSTFFVAFHWKSLLLPAIPIFLSFCIASNLPIQGISLEEQIWWFYQERVGINHPVQFYSEFPDHSPFLWGHSWNLLASIQWLWYERMGLEDYVLSTNFKWWLGFLLSVMVLGGLKKNYRLNSSFILLSSPFLLLLWTGMLYQPNWRRMAIGWIAALLVLLYYCPRKGRMFFLTLFGVVLYGTPIDVSFPQIQPPDIGSLLATHPTPPKEISFRDRQCERALNRDLENGVPWGGRIYSNQLYRRYIQQ